MAQFRPRFTMRLRIFTPGASVRTMNRVLPYVWYPLVFAAALAGFFALLGQGAHPALASYLPVVLAGLTVVALEWKFPERPDWRPRRADVMADAAFMAVVMVAVPKLLAVLAVLAIAAWMHAHAPSA